MIVNHSDDGGEIHSRYDDVLNHIEMTFFAKATATRPSGIAQMCFSQGNFNELVKTMRRLSEAFDEGRHERDVQRWIDWAEENRGSPKLKKYIEGKANALIDKQIERERAEEWERKFAKDFAINRLPASSFTSEPREVFDDKDDPEPDIRIYAYTPENCPSKHYNPGDDFCADCGTDLNPIVTAIGPDGQGVTITEVGEIISTRDTTLYEVMQLPESDRRRVADALTRGLIVFTDY